MSSGPHEQHPQRQRTYVPPIGHIHDRLARFCGEPVHPVRTSRHKLPRRPGRARGLARPDGARDAVHLGRPFADQDWPDMAVVQDGAATAARAGKPLCAAVVSVSAVRTDLRWVNCAMVQAVRESPVGSARRSPTVEHHPVGDSVTAVARVVRAVEATPDFGGELSLLHRHHRPQGVAMWARRSDRRGGRLRDRPPRTAGRR